MHDQDREDDLQALEDHGALQAGRHDHELVRQRAGPHIAADDLIVDEHREQGDDDGEDDRGDIERAVMRDLAAFLHVAHDDVGVVALDRAQGIGRRVFVVVLLAVVLLAEQGEAALAAMLAGGGDPLAALHPVGTPGRRIDRRLEALEKLRFEAGANLRRHRLRVGERSGFAVEFLRGEAVEQLMAQLLAAHRHGVGVVVFRKISDHDGIPPAGGGARKRPHEQTW